jgi:hypothetical protein
MRMMVLAPDAEDIEWPACNEFDLLSQARPMIGED